MAFSLDLQPAIPEVLLDTPIPEAKEVEAAKASSSYNYFSSNGLNFSSGGGDTSESEGDRGFGQGGAGDGASVHDMFFDEDENLGYLEKIYLFARSKAVFHRVFIARALPEYLSHVSPADAVEYVLPLLNGLGTDQDESVREAFVAELVPIMWWFFVSCELIEVPEEGDNMYAEPGGADAEAEADAGSVTVVDEQNDSRASLVTPNDADHFSSPEQPRQQGQQQPSAPPKFLAGTFTPLLGSLLLSQNVLVGEVARNCVVELLQRVVTNDTRDGALGEREREMLERELVEGVIIALARLGEGPPEEDIQMQEADLQSSEAENAEGAVDETAESQASSPSSFEPLASLPMSVGSVALSPLPTPEARREDPSDILHAPPSPSPTSASTAGPIPDSGEGDSRILSSPPSTLSASPIPLSAEPTPGSLSSSRSSINSENTDPSTPSLSSTGNSTSSSSDPEFYLHSSSDPSSSLHPFIAQPSSASTDTGGDDLSSRSLERFNQVATEPQFSAALHEDEFNLPSLIRFPAPTQLLKSADPNVLSTRGNEEIQELHSRRHPVSSLSASLPAVQSSLSSSVSLPSPPARDSAVMSLAPAATTHVPATHSESDGGKGIEIEMPPPWAMVQRVSTPAASSDDSGDITPRIEKGNVLSYEVPAPASQLVPPPMGAVHVDAHASHTPTRPLSQRHDAKTISVPPPGSAPLDTPMYSSSASISVVTESSSLTQSAEPQIVGISASPEVPADSGPESDSALTASPAAAPSMPSTATATSAHTPANAEAVGDEAAAGCVASMSLIAAVAANGYLPEYAKGMFVAEVARVGTDPVYWVRREAAYALGALAKVVDDEMLLEYLVPLYESFVGDSTWQVRQSAVFALPPILVRLSPEERRYFALANFRVLTQDKSRSVRCSMLEVLGEVIYTFINDEGGPPRELLGIFIGSPPEGYRLEPPPPPPPAIPLRLAQSAPSTPNIRHRPQSKRGLLARDPAVQPLRPPPDPETSGVDPVPDLDRPLVCAFNFPAVALTLGPRRWHEVSDYYVQLAREYASGAGPRAGSNPVVGSSRPATNFGVVSQNQRKLVRVRRTLAASLGEMARILGPDIARDHLLPVFWEALHASVPPPPPGPPTYGFMGTSFASVSAMGAAQNFVAAEAEAEDARTKMLECLVLFVSHLAPGEREIVANGLEEAWRDHVRGWREREVFARTFGVLSVPLAETESGAQAMRALIMLALTDNVAAVRDEAVAQLPACFEGLGVSSPACLNLRNDILDLAQSSSFRRRATYVKCAQSLVLSPTLGQHEISQPSLWSTLLALASDSITDVRIGTARATSLIAYRHYPRRNYPPELMPLIRTLRNDASPEVTSFVRFLAVSLPEPVVLPILQPHTVSPFATFSNPPFFGEIFSPSAKFEESEGYLDAVDNKKAADEEAATPHGGREASTQEYQDSPLATEPTSRHASNAHPISPTITPEPPGEDDLGSQRIERPPIYRVWSY